MKKSTVLSVILLAVFLLALAHAVFGEGYAGPGPSPRTKTDRLQSVSVVQAKNLPDDSLVLLSGHIVQSLGREKFTFRDATGDITIEIDSNLWALLGLSVNAGDSVEIRGEIDIEGQTAEIDVKYIRKL